VLSNWKPETEPPAAKGVVVVHRIAKLGGGAAIVSVQPDGLRMLVGDTDRKPAPGIHENQNVPMVVVPVLLSVKSY
jgi:hypothetical protein